MDVRARLTVFFEEPFWRGVYERQTKEGLCVCKVVFGAEPKDYEVFQYILCNRYQMRFSPIVRSAMQEERKISPKRLQRQAGKEIMQVGVCKKAQQAMQQQREIQAASKKAERTIRKKRTQEERFVQKQRKKKEKRKGN